jgi:hypothetical protein
MRLNRQMARVAPLSRAMRRRVIMVAIEPVRAGWALWWWPGSRPTAPAAPAGRMPRRRQVLRAGQHRSVGELADEATVHGQARAEQRADLGRDQEHRHQVERSAGGGPTATGRPVRIGRVRPTRPAARG